MVSRFEIRPIPSKARKGDNFGIPDAQTLRRANRLAERRIEAKLRKELELTVKTWKKKPTFTVETVDDGNDRVIQAFTENQVYNWLDEGTRPHTIVPKRAKVLRFQPGYQPKTSVTGFVAKPGGPFGKHVFAQKVKHPGTKARRFYDKTGRRNLQFAIRQFEQALDSAIKT